MMEVRLQREADCVSGPASVIFLFVFGFMIMGSIVLPCLGGWGGGIRWLMLSLLLHVCVAITASSRPSPSDSDSLSPSGSGREGVV